MKKNTKTTKRKTKTPTSKAVIEYKRSYGQMWYLTTKARLKGRGISPPGDPREHKRKMYTYHVTDAAFKRLKKLYTLKPNTYIKSL